MDSSPTKYIWCKFSSCFNKYFAKLFNISNHSKWPPKLKFVLRQISTADIWRTINISEEKIFTNSINWLKERAGVLTVPIYVEWPICNFILFQPLGIMCQYLNIIYLTVWCPPSKGYFFGQYFSQ